MGKKSRERRERQQQRQQLLQEQAEVARLGQAARFYDHLMQLKKKSQFLTPLHQTPVFVADNVYRHLRTEMESFEFMQVSEWAKHLQTSIRPPFPHLFIEATYTHASSAIERYGLWVVADAPGDSVMIYCIVDYDGLIARKPTMLVHLAGDGYFFEAYPVHPNEAEIVPLSFSPYFTALFTLQLLNCRNVELIDNEPDATLSLAHEKRYGNPLTKFKTLRIMSTHKEREDKPQAQFDIMPLHIRRGNFAHYSDDAPLFGKYTGTFWRPATVVGNEKNGVVVKDYAVVAPESDGN